VALVSRDPFAREELHRETVKPKPQERYHGLFGCAWCGGINARGTLYRYRVETDGGRVHPDSRLFCSVSCYRSYHS